MRVRFRFASLGIQTKTVLLLVVVVVVVFCVHACPGGGGGGFFFFGGGVKKIYLHQTLLCKINLKQPKAQQYN